MESELQRLLPIDKGWLPSLRTPREYRVFMRQDQNPAQAAHQFCGVEELRVCATNPSPSLSQDMASEPANGFNCTNECSAHSLKFPPEGLDCCLGAVLATAVLGAEEIPAGSQCSSSLLETRGFTFRRINNNIKTGLIFGWKAQLSVCL